jgi:hypothetical protein
MIILNHSEEKFLKQHLNCKIMIYGSFLKKIRLLLLKDARILYLLSLADLGLIKFILVIELINY